MRICAFTHCANGDYQLKKWGAVKCKTHTSFREDCSCPRPFRLFTFPPASTDPDGRLTWANIVYRKDPLTGKNWMPKADDRICSLHFFNGHPSEDHPNPCLNLPLR